MPASCASPSRPRSPPMRGRCRRAAGSSEARVGAVNQDPCCDAGPCAVRERTRRIARSAHLPGPGDAVAVLQRAGHGLRELPDGPVRTAARDAGVLAAAGDDVPAAVGVRPRELARACSPCGCQCVAGANASSKARTGAGLNTRRGFATRRGAFTPATRRERTSRRAWRRCPSCPDVQSGRRRPPCPARREVHSRWHP